MDIFPGNPVDPPDLIDMESRRQLGKLRNDEKSFFIPRLERLKPKAPAQVDHGDHLLSRHENPFDAGIDVGHRRHGMPGNDLLDLCDIDAVMVVTDHEFHDLKLVHPPV